jgi:hypothetical protein
MYCAISSVDTSLAAKSMRRPPAATSLSFAMTKQAHAPGAPRPAFRQARAGSISQMAQALSNTALRFDQLTISTATVFFYTGRWSRGYARRLQPAAGAAVLLASLGGRRASLLARPLQSRHCLAWCRLNLEHSHAGWCHYALGDGACCDGVSLCCLPLPPQAQA